MFTGSSFVPRRAFCVWHFWWVDDLRSFSFCWRRIGGRAFVNSFNVMGPEESLVSSSDDRDLDVVTLESRSISSYAVS